jgi:hypothetical protein
VAPFDGRATVVDGMVATGGTMASMTWRSESTDAKAWAARYELLPG